MPDNSSLESKILSVHIHAAFADILVSTTTLR